MQSSRYAPCKNFAALLVFDDLEVLALSGLLATRGWKISRKMPS